MDLPHLFKIETDIEDAQETLNSADTIEYIVESLVKREYGDIEDTQVDNVDDMFETEMHDVKDNIFEIDKIDVDIPKQINNVQAETQKKRGRRKKLSVQPEIDDNDDDSSNFNCNQCGRAFKNKKMLSQHNHSDSSDFECEKYEKKFKENDSDDDTSENYSDNLSDITSEPESDDNDPDDSDSDIASHVAKQPRFVSAPLSSESDVEMDSEDKWTDIDTPRTNECFDNIPGVKVFPEDAENAVEITELFMEEDVFNKITVDTNRYYEKNQHKYKKSTPKWVDLTVGELKVFFALIILMGQVRKKKMTDYWSKNPLIETSIFAKMMSRNRFTKILTFLHFNDDEKSNENTGRLVKVQWLMDYFLNKFQTVYTPRQNISLNEGMIPWRGKLLFKVYNPSKVVKYGILIRTVCESTTGYVSNLKIYSNNVEKIEDTVTSLLSPLSGMWYHVYMDNFYNSAKLAERLLCDKFRMCGTIRINRSLPDYSKDELKLRPLQSIFRRKGEVLLQTFKNNKKTKVRMISTIHNSKFATAVKCDSKTGLPVQKPECIIDYNTFMKGAYQVDQYLIFYPIFRKTHKWSKKVALYLFNCAFFNAFCVYKELNPSNKIKYEEFLLNIAKSWLTIPDDEPTGPCNSLQPSIGSVLFDPPGRLSGNLKQHMLEKIVSSKTKKYVRRACRVCSAHKKRGDTSYKCKFCDVPLHRGDCFNIYHTKKIY